MTRQSEPGPKDGTYVIQIEIPDLDPGTNDILTDDMRKFEAFVDAVRNLSGALFPETWVTFHRLMPDKGRHSGPINPDT